MHTFIELARQHTCALNHTSTLIQHMCMRVWTALYKSSHFYAAPSVCCRNRMSCAGESQVTVFFLAWYQYQYLGSIDFSFFACAAAKVCSLHIFLGRFHSCDVATLWTYLPALSIKLQLILHLSNKWFNYEFCWSEKDDTSVWIAPV